MNLKVGVEVGGVSLSPTQSCRCCPESWTFFPSVPQARLLHYCFLCVGIHTVLSSELVSKAAGKMNKTHSSSPSWTLEIGRGWKRSLLKGKVLDQVTQDPVLWRCEWPTASLGPRSSV